MYATNDHVVFLQFIINLLDLGSRRTPSNAKASDRIIFTQHFLEFITNPVSNRERRNLFLIQLFKREETVIASEFNFAAIHAACGEFKRFDKPFVSTGL